MAKLAALFWILLLPACAPAHDPATHPLVRDVNEVDYRCDSDADCSVKDVGNCCGYYPACVNRNSPTFAQRVQAECAKKNMAGVCGFPDITGCRCVAHRCAENTSGGENR